MVASRNAGTTSAATPKSAAPKFFTVVFAGNIRKLPGNPHMFETPFGEVVAMGVGDAFADVDRLTEIMEPIEALATGLRVVAGEARAKMRGKPRTANENLYQLGLAHGLEVAAERIAKAVGTSAPAGSGEASSGQAPGGEQ